MKHSIGALSGLSGVSVRALHYYDQIGLLQPSEVAETGYRYYDDHAVERLWQILFYRELGFSLRDIGVILSSPDFDKARALEEHRTLLLQKRDRLDGLIDLVSNALKGERTMEFEPFDTSKIDALREQYAAEAKERWGESEAYQESARRDAGRTKADRDAIQQASEDVIRAFAALVGVNASDARVQSLVQRWQSFITAHYYNCTNEILAGLGQMYVADERFQNNLDAFGAGTAKLMSDAIAVYCKNSD
jgi:DNA-binding transcriptional MerR regulator